MDDSMINPILLSSSVYLQNVEQLIKNLEKHTNNVQNIDDSSITKSYTSNTNSTTDDANNWTIKSSIEQSINKPQQICSQSNPVSSPGSSTTSSSTSWRQMKESQRIITDTETKQTRSTSPLSLYKIFQQKSQANSSSIRNTSQLSRSIKNVTNQAIQTSIHLTTVSKSKSYNYLIPSTSNTSSSVHKSLPDLSFISHYTKELPRSLTTSPVRSTTSITRTTPSPTLIHQQKQDFDRPRTLKSIKRYKNNKHSTEPLHVFYSPQLRKNSNNQSIPPKQTLNLNEKTLVRKHHSNDDLLKENQIRTSAISYTENISKHFISPCKLSKKSTDHLSMLTKRYGEMRRCQTDIIVVDPILHDHSLTDSPPNEFCLQPDEETTTTRF